MAEVSSGRIDATFLASGEKDDVCCARKGWIFCTLSHTHLGQSWAVSPSLLVRNIRRLQSTYKEETMRHDLHHDAPASTRFRVYRSRFLSAMLASLSFIGMVDFARSQSLVDVDAHLAANEWVKNTVENSFGGEAKELVAYRKLQSTREVKTDERAPTPLEEEFKGRLTEEMLTRLRDDRDPESIFEFENDACECTVVEKH